MEEDTNWEEHGRYMVYKVKYMYEYPEEDHKLSEVK